MRLQPRSSSPSRKIRAMGAVSRVVRNPGRASACHRRRQDGGAEPVRQGPNRDACDDETDVDQDRPREMAVGVDHGERRIERVGVPVERIRVAEISCEPVIGADETPRNAS